MIAAPKGATSYQLWDVSHRYDCPVGQVINSIGNRIITLSVARLITFGVSQIHNSKLKHKSECLCSISSEIEKVRIMRTFFICDTQARRRLLRLSPARCTPFFEIFTYYPSLLTGNGGKFAVVLICTLSEKHTAGTARWRAHACRLFFNNTSWLNYYFVLL